MRWFTNLLRLRALNNKYEQLELELRLAPLALQEAHSAAVRAEAEAHDARQLLRESELARAQLELDLGAANRRNDRLTKLLTLALEAMNRLRAQLANTSVAQPRDDHGRYKARAAQ